MATLYSLKATLNLIDSSSSVVQPYHSVPYSLWQPIIIEYLLSHTHSQYKMNCTNRNYYNDDGCDLAQAYNLSESKQKSKPNLTGQMHMQMAECKRKMYSFDPVWNGDLNFGVKPTNNNDYDRWIQPSAFAQLSSTVSLINSKLISDAK